MKRRALKDKKDFSFWSSEKCCKVFSNINDGFNSSLWKCLIYLPHVIPYTIASDYIKVKFYDGNGVVKTEIRQKVLLQISICGIHMDMLKKDATGFSRAYDEKGLVCISDSIRLLLPPHLLKLPSIIKLWVVEKYVYRMEHTKSL